MFDWFRGRSVKPATQRCAGCQRVLPLDQMVHINACYHAPHYAHAGCMGARVLCPGCHLARGTFGYYAAYFQAKALLSPAQYPWEEAMIGLERYLTILEFLTRTGIDPADKRALEIAWRSARRALISPLT